MQPYLDGLHPIRLDDFSVLTPGAPPLAGAVTVWVSAADRALLGRATGRKLRALVKVQPADPAHPGAALIGSVVAENTDGSLIVDSCGNGYSDVLGALGRPSGLTAAQALNEVLAQPSGSLAQALRNLDRTPPTLPWASQPADQRAIDNAPPSVRADLSGVALAFEIPASWRTLDGALCSHISLGLNGCAAFSAAVFVKARNVWVVLVSAWVAAGQPLVVTYQPSASLAGASSVTIGQVDPGTLQRARGPNAYLVFDLTRLARPSELLHGGARFDGVEQCCS